MNRIILTVLAILSGIAVATLTFSCQKNNAEEESYYSAIDPGEQLINDQKDVCFNGPVYFDDGLNSGFDNALKNRINMFCTITNDATVVIIDASKGTASKDVVQCVITAFSKGRSLMFNNPVKEFFDSLLEQIPADNYGLKKYCFLVKKFVVLNNSAFLSISIKNGGILVVPKSNVSVTYSSELCDLNSGTISPHESSTPVEKSEDTPYSYGLAADRAVLWTNETRPERSNESNSVEDLMSASVELTIQYTINFDSQRQFGTGLKIARTVPVEERYLVWPVYDAGTGRNRDLYLIQRNILFYGSNLQCGPTKPEDYWQTGGNYGCYGPFLRSMVVKTCMVDGKNPTMTDLEPKNAMGSTSYTEGFNWSLNGGVSIGKEPAITFGGSVGLSYSSATSVPDLKMEVKYNQNAPEFIYEAGTLPINHNRVFGDIYHDTAKPNLTTDINMGQKWIYEISSIPGDNFTIATDYSAEIDMLNCKYTFFYTKDIYMQARYTFPSIKIPLPAPPRVKQTWRQSCNPGSEALDKFLAEKYAGLYYNSLVYIGGDTDGDREGVDKFISKFISAVQSDQETWRRRGFVGKYTFSWTKLDDKGGSQLYKTYDFEVKK